MKGKQEEDVYDKSRDEPDEYQQQSHDENGTKNYYEIKDESKDEYPHEYKDYWNYNDDNGDEEEDYHEDTSKGTSTEYETPSTLESFNTQM